MQKLSDSEIETALADLVDWHREGDQLKAQFVFADFRRAFAFIAEMALWAEKLNHHPTWENTYNRVDVALSTHDAGGITSLDVDLASQMTRAAKHA